MKTHLSLDNSDARGAFIYNRHLEMVKRISRMIRLSNLQGIVVGHFCALRLLAVLGAAVLVEDGRLHLKPYKMSLGP